MLIYAKNADNTAVLAPREFMRARLIEGIGSDWTEVRLGMYFCGVDAHDENSPGPPMESVVVTAPSDYVFFGLKNAGSDDLPGEAGSLFIGVRSTGLVSLAEPLDVVAGAFADDAGECSAVGYSGVTAINGGVIENGALRFPDPAGASDYNGFYCLMMTVSNRGGGAQSVNVSAASTDLVPGSDYSRAALYQAINNAAFGAPRSVNWNSGGVARALPDAAWARIPFYNFRLRIQEIMAVKISP